MANLPTGGVSHACTEVWAELTRGLWAAGVTGAAGVGAERLKLLLRVATAAGSERFGVLRVRAAPGEDRRARKGRPRHLKNEKFGDILEIDESPEEDEFDEDEVDEDEFDEDEVDEDESDEYWEGLDFDGEDEDEPDLDED